jgi:hypothetical protein
MKLSHVLKVIVFLSIAIGHIPRNDPHPSRNVRLPSSLLPLEHQSSKPWRSWIDPEKVRDFAEGAISGDQGLRLLIESDGGEHGVEGAQRLVPFVQHETKVKVLGTSDE